MADLTSWNTVDLKTDGNWVIRFSQNDEGVDINLHWGDRDTPTHCAFLTNDEFARVVVRMTEKFS